MGRLQATWIPGSSLFFWVDAAGSPEVLTAELPALAALPLRWTSHTLAHPTGASGPSQRISVDGAEIEVGELVQLLPQLRNDASLSDSVLCFSMASRLGLELAARQAVVPTADDTSARWRVLLARPEDRSRFDQVAQALPLAARLLPTRDRGTVRLHTSRVVLRAFVDAIADSVYRSGAWPGPARGWTLDLADALRGTSAAFAPRDARFYGVPAILAAWSQEEHTSLRLHLRLALPPPDHDRFSLEVSLVPSDEPYGGARIPLSRAWSAGTEIAWLGERYTRPSWQLLRSLARASRVFKPLREALGGPEPRDLSWTADQAWAFIDSGAPALADAGVIIELPATFEAAGSRRIHARMRLAAEGEQLQLSGKVRFTWEVLLGERLLGGAEFAQMVAVKQPMVPYHGTWILLDPAELARLPRGLPAEGTLDGGEALRAILTGQHEGVPVVTDDRLSWMVEALRQPPQRAVPEGLRGVLRPYQLRGFSWLACLGDLGLGACLADDMGLGKTIQVISHLLDRHERLPGRCSLVVCPTSVLTNWARELQRFAPSLKVLRYHGASRDVAMSAHHDVVLTTYGVLTRDGAALSEVDWDVVVLDEAQAIKNPDSVRARSALDLRARHRVAVSGTPVENRLDELWSLMRFLVPGLLGSRNRFRNSVAVPVEKLGDHDVARRLRLGTSPFIMRRLKADPSVAADLPDKIERRVYCTLTPEQAALYHEVAQTHLDRIREGVRSRRRGLVLAMLTALKQVCNHPANLLKDGLQEGVDDRARSGKLQQLIELLHTLAPSGDRTVVFTHYREMGELLVQSLARTFGWTAPFLHGGCSIPARDEMVRAFQEGADPCPVLIVSLRAGGVGLNLTRATHVVHYDRWWNPAVEDQATDRAHRIGQVRNVLVHKLITPGTLEERIDRMLEDKRLLAESVVGSGERLITELDDDTLRALVALGDDATLEEE